MCSTHNKYLQYLKLSTYAEEAESDGIFFKKATRDLSGVTSKEKEESDFESTITRFFYSSKKLEGIEKSVDSKDRLQEPAGEFNKIIDALKINYSKFEEVIKKKEEHEKITEIYILKILIHFLTLHSWGNYKRLITLFESFVIHRNGEYELSLRTYRFTVHNLFILS